MSPKKVTEKPSKGQGGKKRPGGSPLRAVFHATGAHVGRVDSEYCCAFWADNPLDVPRFDPQRLTDVDLRRSPSHTTPSNVIVDDFVTDGGLTTIGPGFPAGSFFGAVYLEERYWASLPTGRQPALPPRGATGQPHEYKAVLYWPGTGDPRAGRRYIGTHAEIVGAPPGANNVVDVRIWAPGTSGATKPAVRTLIDLDSIDYCDPESLGGLTTLTSTRRAGALFLSLSYATQVGLAASPKLPLWKGVW